MRRWIVRAALVLAASPALAADYSAGLPDEYFTGDWSGPYVGINGGAAWGHSRWSAGGAATTDDFHISGGMAGATFGYDIQVRNWVWGVVADIDWTDIEGTDPTPCSPNCMTSNDWLATARGRIGFAHGAFLPYLTGGLAVGDVKAHFNGNTTGVDTDTQVGWAAGAGIEYQFRHGWSLWVEYLYADLGSATCRVIVCSGPPNNSSVDFVVSMVRAGINRRF